MRRRSIAALLAVASFVAARPARAQAPAARPAPADSPPITPPRAISLPRTPYPGGASGHARVVLEVRVDRSGAVVDAHAVSGDEPFAGAAVGASRSWRFDPATRGGQPVDARIRVQVDFTPPPPASPAAPPPPPAPVSGRATSERAAPGGPAPPRPAVATPPLNAELVHVGGKRHEPPHHEMSGGEVRQLPGAFGDAFRAIEALPGVTPIVSGLPYFLVRGAPPGDTGFFIDGVRVPALFHLGVGAAVVHPALVDRVDFYAGAYPARFGRFSGGILSGEIVPFPDPPHAEASVRLIDLGLMASTPVAGGRGDVMVSGRYGYPGPLLQAVAALLDPKAKVNLQYWDYQVRGRWRISHDDEVGAFVFGSFDLLEASGSSVGIQFHRADLRWDHRTSATGRLRLALTLGYDELHDDEVSTGSVSGSVSGGVSSTHSLAIRSTMLGLRSEWSDRLAPQVEARLGSDVVLEPYVVAVPGLTPIGGLHGVIGASGVPQSQAETGFVTDFGNGFRQTDVNGSVYGELVWRPTRQVEVLPGLRVDAFTSRYPQAADQAENSQARVTVDPRLTARWKATPSFAVVSALGVAHQPSNIPVPSPALNFSQLSRGLQTAYQYSEGVELTLPWQFSGSLDGFVHDYTGLADYYDDCGGGPCIFGGRAIGLEVMLRRKLSERFTGWISYTLSRVVRGSVYSAGGTMPARYVERLSEFDRTHVFNAVLSADLGKRWRAGARVIAYSGLPYDSHDFGDGPPDSRGPPFVRLDVRLEKAWPAFGGTMRFVLEWLNALLQKETLGTSCSATYTHGMVSPVTCSPTQIPVPITFPSLGLEWTSDRP